MLKTNQVYAVESAVGAKSLNTSMTAHLDVNAFKYLRPCEDYHAFFFLGDTQPYLGAISFGP